MSVSTVRTTGAGGRVNLTSLTVLSASNSSMNRSV